MKKSIVTTFIVCFVLLFTLSLTVFLFFQPDSLRLGMMGGGMMRLWMLLLISGLVALLITALNFADNQRLRRDFTADIERLTVNEKPVNPELARIQKHIANLSGELQRLSNPNTALKAEIIEGERKRISRELHDSVSQELFAATMILSSVEGSTDLATVQAQTSLSLKILHEAQNEMRALLLHLRPIELDGKSLSLGLTALVNELTAKVSANINYRLDEVQASSVIEDNLFRMAQEILSNTLRHAQAENIDITLRENAGNILLTIHDDGVGFDPDQVNAENSASYGLSNLTERALLLGGVCQISSQPNQGTTVEIRVPKND